MGRRIDPDNPLSDDDRAFLLARGEDSVVRLHDARFQDVGDTNVGVTGAEPSLGSDRTEVNGQGLAQINMQVEGHSGDPVAQGGVSEPTLAAVTQYPSDNYDTLGKEDLRSELEDRDLPVSGNKAELIARLRESDAAVAGDEDDSDDSDDSGE